MRQLGVRHTVAACYTGYITQAIINNFAPLLFVTFNTDYGISLTLIGTMITVNFGVQLLVDLLSAKFVDKIGYRPCMVAAHVFAGGGLILLAVLPNVLPVPVVGLFLASAVYAVGGGLIEVLVSPVIEACPSKNKKAAMSLLHSFYCWGQVGVVGLSTLFFVLAGIENWVVLACVWAAVPLLNAVYFCFVPFFRPVEEGQALRIPQLLKTRSFWLFAVLIACAGAAELAVSQWASAFAEEGLGVNKTVGDLLGPCLFAVCMGLARVLFSLFGKRVPIKPALMAAAVGCAGGYCLCAFAPASQPWMGLLGCGAVGLFVGIMWPGTFSFASERIPKGGTAMFALLALAGDLGCTAGPSAVGALSDAFGGSIRTGIAFGLAVPALMFFVLLFSGVRRKKPLAPLSAGVDGAAEEEKDGQGDGTPFSEG